MDLKQLSQIPEFNMLLILEKAFPNITCKEAREALTRLKDEGIVIPFNQGKHIEKDASQG